jgi:hypothetical protein
MQAPYPQYLMCRPPGGRESGRWRGWEEFIHQAVQHTQTSSKTCGCSYFLSKNLLKMVFYQIKKLKIELFKDIL